MARAETIESVGETGGGGNGPLSHHNTCHMGLPQAFHNLHGLLTTTTITTGSGTDPTHLHHNHHPAHPFQAVYLPCLLPYLHPEDQEEPQTHQHLATLSASPSPTPPPSPRCNPLGDRGAGFSGEHSDSGRQERRDAHSRRGPLPDLLPQNEHPSWASPNGGAPGEGALCEVEVRRVANQLRAIGDDLHATVLQGAHAVPHWQDWRDACRGLLNFITQTLSTLYRLT